MDPKDAMSWSVADVGKWLLERGYSKDMKGKFESQEIDGEALFKMENKYLKEMRIPIGRRFKILKQIQKLKEDASAPQETDTDQAKSENAANTTNPGPTEGKPIDKNMMVILPKKPEGAVKKPEAKKPKKPEAAVKKIEPNKPKKPEKSAKAVNPEIQAPLKQEQQPSKKVEPAPKKSEALVPIKPESQVTDSTQHSPREEDPNKPENSSNKQDPPAIKVSEPQPPTSAEPSPNNPDPENPAKTEAGTPKSNNPEAPNPKKTGFFSRIKNKILGPSKSAPADFVLSGPKNFQHKSHMGYNPKNSRFEVENIPEEWKSLFRKVGIQDEDLKNEQAAPLIFQEITKGLAPEDDDIEDEQESMPANPTEASLPSNTTLGATTEAQSQPDPALSDTKSSEYSLLKRRESHRPEKPAPKPPPTDQDVLAQANSVPVAPPLPSIAKTPVKRTLSRPLPRPPAQADKRKELEDRLRDVMSKIRKDVQGHDDDAETWSDDDT